MPDFDFSGTTVVIIDDMASTGRTLASATRSLLEVGAQSVYAAITHPLYCDDAENHILKSGLKQI